MANSVIGALRVMLGMDTAEFEKGADRATRQSKRLQKDLEQTARNLTRTGLGLTAAITAPLTAFAVKGIAEARESAAAIAQVEAALASMGPVAGRTSEQLEKAANAFEGKSLFEADVILKDVTANLLTFGNIAGEAFDRAQQAAIDLATRLNIGPKEAAIQVGKALNDPIKGITALGRAGIQFSEDQKAMIKALVETGNAAGAQNIILKELERQFGGAAQAAQNADPFNALTDSINGLAESIGKALLPVLKPMITGLKGVVDSFTTLPQGAQTAIIVIGGLAAAIGPLLVAAGAVTSAIATLTPLFVGLTIPLAPLAAGLAVVGAAGYAIYQNWDKIAPVLDAIGQSFESAIGPDLRATIDSASAKLTELWDGPLGEAIRVVSETLLQFQLAYGRVLGEGLIRVLDVAVTVAGAQFNAILDLLTAVSRFLSGDFRGAWEAMGQFVSGIARTVAGAIEALFPGLIQLGKDIIRGIVGGIRAAPGAVRDALLGVVQSGVDTVKDFLGIRSPSLLFMEVGSNIMQGLALGIQRGEGIVSDAFTALSEQTQVQTVRIADTVQQMVERIGGHLRGLVDGIKKGDFLSIFEGLIGIGTTLGGAGVFGRGVQGFLNSVPGFASGGAMRLGGRGGVDSNLLSLNGTPLARVSRGETMEIRPQGQGGAGGVSGLRVVVTMDESTGALGAFVRDEAGREIGRAAPAIANAGAQQALGRIQQIQRQQLA